MLKKETLTTAATVAIGFGIAFLIVGTSQTFQSCIGEHYRHEPSETLQKGFAQLLVMSKVGSGCFGEFVHKNAESIIALLSAQGAWRTVRWREGSTHALWSEGETEPTKYWLSTLPAKVSLRRLVDFAKLRWRVERDYQELKQEVGLGHYEGRG